MATEPEGLTPPAVVADKTDGPTKWDPVVRPPMDAASRMRIKTAQRVIAILLTADVLIAIGSRTATGQKWVFGIGVLANLVFDVVAVVYCIRNWRKPGGPSIVPRTEMKWNMVELTAMLLLFGELFLTGSGRQVIFMLLLFWVPIFFLFCFYILIKGLVDLFRRKKASKSPGRPES